MVPVPNSSMVVSVIPGPKFQPPEGVSPLAFQVSSLTWVNVCSVEPKTICNESPCAANMESGKNSKSIAVSTWVVCAESTTERERTARVIRCFMVVQVRMPQLTHTPGHTQMGLGLLLVRALPCRAAW